MWFTVVPEATSPRSVVWRWAQGGGWGGLGRTVGALCRSSPASPRALLLLFQFLLLKKKLEDEFPGLLSINGEGTRGVTGFFEVTVAGKLVHSKKAGHGFVDSSEKYLQIVAEIKAVLG
uniref:Selenoprotein W n=1 Tax=Sarcophilus harrisii TaxID=9305 RepID=A0A7N4NJF0_SARHA